MSPRIGYWFGVRKSVVQNVIILNQHEWNGADRRGNRIFSSLIRCSDQIGMPIAGPAPTVAAVAARSKVLKAAAAGEIPGNLRRRYPTRPRV